MNLELILAGIGAVAVVLVTAVGLFVGVSLVVGRLRSGRWFWDEWR